MNPLDHEACAERIERSMTRLDADDHELLIEGCMLAAAHRVNAHLHRHAVRAEGDDLMHTYLLTINEFRRLCVAAKAALEALAEIEDLRPAFVRGDYAGGREAARHALQLLDTVRNSTRPSQPSPRRNDP